MKTLKYMFLMAALCIFVTTASANAETKTAVKDLNYQLVNEIKIKLAQPLLNYRNKDLKGNVSLLVSVEENGKLKFTNITGLNESLKENIEKQLNELNLWTGKEYAGTKFSYTIRYKN